MMRGLLHELRNPLSSIITAATLLQDSAQPGPVDVGEEGQMLLDVIKKESLRLNHILTEFAEYIKTPLPEATVFDLAATVNATIGELQREGVLAPEIQIENRLDGACHVCADETLIRNALRQLFNNAAEAMPAGGSLLLTSARTASPGEAGICLSDSGKGFSHESRERAFQPFYSTKSQGIGLGLSVVKSIVESASGQIWIDNGQAAGLPESGAAVPTTSICFVLPAAP